MSRGAEACPAPLPSLGPRDQPGTAASSKWLSRDERTEASGSEGGRKWSRSQGCQGCQGASVSQPFRGGPESKMLRDVVLRVADDQLGGGQGGLGRHGVGVRAVCGSRLAEALLVSV